MPIMRQVVHRLLRVNTPANEVVAVVQVMGTPICHSSRFVVPDVVVRQVVVVLCCDLPILDPCSSDMKFKTANQRKWQDLDVVAYDC